jgi:sialidase-1
MKCLSLALLSFFSVSVALAAEPSLTQIDLFEAGQGGYEFYRIPGIVATPGGQLLAYCEARKNAKADWGHVDILMRRSSDGGTTWTEPQKIVTLEGQFERNPAAVAQGLGKAGEITINNPVAIVDSEQNVVHFLYCVEYNRLFHMSSSDDGETFSKPVEIAASVETFRPDYDWQSFAVGPGHGIQLNNGRLLATVWLSTGKGGHAHRPSIVSTIYSDDGGKSWQRGDIVAGEQRPLLNPSESVVVQLSDGQVMINCRSESKEHRRAVALSPDGATHWTEPRFDDALREPVCMASILRIKSNEQPADSRKPALVFANPDTTKGRTNLSIKLSSDDGTTWPVNRVLEPGPSAYSDLAATPDGTIYCFYESGAGTGNAYRYLRLAKFNLDWVTEKNAAP